MRVCITTSEFLGVGPTGGLGVATHSLSQHLAARGVQVCVVTPQSRRRCHSTPSIEGVSIRTYDRTNLELFKQEVRSADADVYHHVQASLAAYLAQSAMPDRAHVVECADPRDWNDWLTEFRYPTRSALRLIPSFVYFGTQAAARSIRRADAIQVPARFLQGKVRRLYGVDVNPKYVPRAFHTCCDQKKSTTPLAVFVGRLDRRKRPEISLNLAQAFPSVHFLFIGEGSDKRYSCTLHDKAQTLSNATFTDFIDPAADKRLYNYLSKAWMLINTSAREGLPNTFIEAGGHSCAILSECDPDGYASKFGYCVTDGNFEVGLKWLLADANWKYAGARARKHVIQEHDPDNATDKQLSVYQSVIARRAE